MNNNAKLIHSWRNFRSALRLCSVPHFNATLRLRRYTINGPETEASVGPTTPEKGAAIA